MQWVQESDGGCEDQIEDWLGHKYCALPRLAQLGTRQGDPKTRIAGTVELTVLIKALDDRRTWYY